MIIIPAIDIINGQCVRLEKGDYDKKTTYHSDPLVVAKEFEQAGIKHLHLVDLDGAKAHQVVNLPILRSIISETNLIVDFGGGIKTEADLIKVLNAGAVQITGGSIAAKNKELFLSWITKYGSEKIILGADVLNEKIMVSGWQEGTALDLMEYLEFYSQAGINYVICTDISKDGMMAGPSFDLYQKIRDQFPQLKLIASGGVTTMDDVEKLDSQGLYGAIIGKAIYERTISLEQLKQYIQYAY
jgi:phosphoribosylformimino-5-aminoimidazole carboxamide ribotide isomerase